MLKEASYETNDGETAKSSHRYIIQSSHHEKVLDDRNNDWHHRKSLLPIQKGLISSQTGIIIEAKINLEASPLFHKFNDRHLCTVDDLNTVASGYALPSKKVRKAVEQSFRSLVGETVELSWMLSTVPDEIDEVDVSCRKKQASSMGAECMQFSRFQTAESFLYVEHDLLSDREFVFLWPYPRVEIQNFFV